MLLEKRFKEETLKIKKLLLSVKKECEKEQGDLDKNYWIKYVKELKKRKYPKINKHFLTLNEMTNMFDQKEFELHKVYLRNNLLELFAQTSMPLNWQIIQKPLGYAGDYIVSNYFYEEGFSGESLYSMFMDRYTMESPLATAHRNRKKYLSKLITKLSYRCENKLKVASFACGSSPEVFEVYENGINNVSFTLIDGEEKAIEFLIEKGKKYPQFKVNVRLYHRNIIDLVRKSEYLEISEQNLIYCAGFFDYIKDSTATRLIKYMLHILSPGGWLIVLNVSMHDINDVCLKMLSEWDMYHRSEERMMQLVENIEGITQKKVLPDFYTKRNLYLIIKKK
ncbi:MAG: class I SAM-dependent methyltransferase [Candidatus Omnitrophica bacterium]|nr:class I SAM-dependent methyltransferase [Candidatus Omnitrophota bacterium]MBU1997689.1 class I SAM-dependent methyltransferase [Candidatus Omnitrophota bacterium]